MAGYIDYHVHTNNSRDSRATMTAMCERAITVGLSEIAVTDHFNNHPKDVDLNYYRADRYFADIEQCRAKFPTLTIRAGIEVGEPHRWEKQVVPILESYPYDVVLGSLHWIGDYSIFEAPFFRDHSPEKAYTLYFTELAEMIRHGGFDILAHVDVPKRNSVNYYGPFRDEEFEDLFRQVWEACIETGIVPEINTKGIRSAAGAFHPTTTALRWYAEMGGERLSFGSDAHQPDHLGLNFDQAHKSAFDAGLARTVRFERRAIVGWQSLEPIPV
ncbi:MAG TPA: histidinol-phosphatase HisJ family protein [Aggregatilineales bacterium]|nr:histidinol-phosphatase HisJ family protein [Aggregatilineales bacterium]